MPSRQQSPPLTPASPEKHWPCTTSTLIVPPFPNLSAFAPTPYSCLITEIPETRFAANQSGATRKRREAVHDASNASCAGSHCYSEVRHSSGPTMLLQRACEFEILTGRQTRRATRCCRQNMAPHLPRTVRSSFDLRRLDTIESPRHQNSELAARTGAGIRREPTGSSKL